MDDWLSQATPVAPAAPAAPPEDEWLRAAEPVAKPPMSQFEPSWLEKQLGAVGTMPYGEGAGYLIDNPITRGLAQAGNSMATGANELVDRVLVRPVSDTLEYFNPSDGPSLSDQFRSATIAPLTEDAQQLQAPRGDTVGASVQALGNVAGQVAGGSLSGGAMRTAATLGTLQAGEQAAQLAAQGRDVSNLDVAMMAAAGTAANLIPTVGRGIARIPAGAAAGMAGNELVNAVAGNEAGTGMLMAGALGGTLGALPQARVDVDAIAGLKGPEAQGAATADAILADLPNDPTALGPDALAKPESSISGFPKADIGSEAPPNVLGPEVPRETPTAPPLDAPPAAEVPIRAEVDTPVPPQEAGQSLPELTPDDLSPAELAAFDRFKTYVPPEDVLANNASGESAGSMEAINRVRDDATDGKVRMVIERNGEVRPLVAVDAVDTAAKDGRVIVQRGIGKDEWTVVDADPAVSRENQAFRVKAAQQKLNDFRAVDEPDAPVREWSIDGEESIDTSFPAGEETADSSFTSLPPRLRAEARAREASISEPAEKVRAPFFREPAKPEVAEKDAGVSVREEPEGNPTLPSRGKELLKVRGVWEASSDVLRKDPAFAPLAKAVDDHYDAMERRQGEASRFLRKPMKALEDADRASFTAYQRDIQNGRTPAKPTPGAQRLIDGWKAFAEHSGAENQRVGVKVYDERIGGYRDIGRAKDFFPRMIKDEYRKAMRDPNAHPKEWAAMVKALMDSGHIKDEAEAGRYLNNSFNDESRSDYFAGIEKARTSPLPESLYDYSPDTALKYAQSWAERLSQIESFGQKLGPQGKDLFDTMMGKTTDEGTKAYIDTVGKLVYKTRSRDSFAKTAQTLNMIATGLQLGNPATSALNVVGGLFQNMATFGVGRSVRTLAELRSLAKHIDDAHDIGVLRGDYLQIQHDASALDVNQKVRDFTANSLKVGGYNLTETANRLHGYLLAKDFLRSASKSLKKNPMSGGSKQYLRFIQRVGADYEKLLAENGSGPETERFIRKAVNEAQFSYNLSQTPVYQNTDTGKFLFKYQKFGAQMSRYYWQNVQEPFMKSIVGKETVKVRDPSTGKMIDAKVGAAGQLVNFLRYWAVAGVAGNLILEIRQGLFNYQNNAPEWSEIEKAAQDDEKMKALALLAERAWASNLAIGGLGFFSNYVQMGADIADRQRVKNPLNPPGLAPIIALTDLGMTLIDQKGQGFERALNDTLEKSVSLYRTGKRLAAKGAAATTDSEFGRLHTAKGDVAFTKKMTRRYADERGIEAKRRAPTEIIATPMTPVNKDIQDALLLGDSKKAVQIAQEKLKTATSEKEHTSIVRSIESSVRLRVPSMVGVAPSAAERRDFLTWAKKNLMEEEYERIKAIDDRYIKAAVEAGFLR